MRQPDKIIKRDGTEEGFDKKKITIALHKAMSSIGEPNWDLAEELTEKVVRVLGRRFTERNPNIEEIQDIVEDIIIAENLSDLAKEYISYRRKRNEIREISKMFGDMEVIEGYLKETDWMVKENSNMTFSLQGLNFHISSKLISRYWLKKIYPIKLSKLHSDGDFHLHDLGILGPYCVGWDLKDLLYRGFKGVRGKIESRPAKRLRSATGQIVNYFYTLQGEAAGAQAFSNFDSYLAPFIRYDGLDEKGVRQIMQEFLYNMNVPTRVGFQCMSEDTEILTPDGWAGYNDLEKGDVIKTFNIQTGEIEDKPIRNLFKREYEGQMYSLKNRIQEQLISPEHRVVRKKFNGGFTLEKIEDIEKMKSPFIIPVAGENKKKDIKIKDEEIKLLAWIVAEGSIENYKKHRHSSRISIYQSKIVNPKNYSEIIGLLKKMKLKYSERDSAPALGNSVKMIRLNAESSKKIHKLFGTKESLGFVPSVLLNMSKRQSKLFLDTYLKADGFEDCKISTTKIEILDGLQQIAVNSGYGFTVLERKPTIGKKMIYVLRLIKHKETYIQRIEKVRYKGIIWCPNTDNETVIARRNGKVFITGNTPFTNITMDLTMPKMMSEEPVIIGGEFKDEVYGDFQEEMNLLNKVFADLMMEGDAKGRVFSFPIPTYNITKDFDWDNEIVDKIMDMSSKYGIPYFSNFVNSDMSPEDARSMCCRLRLDNRELRKRGGGLFGANPLTGSLGVVTINMPRLGYLSKDENMFFEKLDSLMDSAKESLILKRKIIEKYTERGLYPYSKYYLQGMYDSEKEYWKNHFSTIGLNGMNEALLNMFGVNIASKEGKKFAEKTLEHMRDRLGDYQAETGSLFNLEATPAEGTAYRFARADKMKYKDIITANEDSVRKGMSPYYTNSTQLPVGYTSDIFEALDIQDSLQTKYTGGTVFHGYIGEQIEDSEVTKKLVKKIAYNYNLPYYTISPTFSICPIHGYVAGNHPYCPHKHSDEELQKHGTEVNE